MLLLKPTEYVWLLLTVITITGAQDQVCYDGLGCFNQTEPWVNSDRPFPPPQSPEEMNVTLTFFSRKEKKGQTFPIYPKSTFSEAGGGYKQSRRVAIITHGFASSSNADWVHEMKDNYLKAVDANVFLVNWEQGASSMNYLQAASNTRVVGKMLGLFGTDLIKVHRSSVRNFHMIGHSLGSHVSAYAAVDINSRSKIGKIQKLTGLDPAQPGFQNQSATVRLSPDKARFVEAIHSDAKPFIPTFGFGFMEDLGTVDLYLNQGFNQPGCVDTVPIDNLTSIDQLANIPVEVISNAVACSHGRAYNIYNAAIDPGTPCKFIGHRVTNRVPITSDQSSCGTNNTDCYIMGIYGDTSKKGAFQVVTGSKKPYCCYNYSPVMGCSDSNSTTPAVTTPPVPVTTPPVAVTTPPVAVTTPAVGI